MAPEVYAEESNELVDIYSFGMCILEMVTFEYPYNECTHLAQIYKKAISGKKPDALYKVKDPEVRLFVEKCLATVSDRLTAKELLEDSFLRNNDEGFDLRPINDDKISQIVPLPYQSDSFLMDSSYEYAGYEPNHEQEYQTLEMTENEIELFTFLEGDDLTDIGITIKGKRRTNGDIFLRLRISDNAGRVRNIYFPFDTESDTAMSVTTEMVCELSIKEEDVKRIADMIDCEIASLVSDWKKDSTLKEASECASVKDVKECVTERISLADYLCLGSPSPVPHNIQLLRCSSHGSTSMRGRFEEITYPSEGDGAESGVIMNTEAFGHHRRPSLNFHFGETYEPQDQSSSENDTRIMRNYMQTQTPYNSPSSSIADDSEYENEARKELIWLKAKYQVQLRDLSDQHSTADMKPRFLAAEKDYNRLKWNKKIPFPPLGRGLDDNDLKKALQKCFSPQFASNSGTRKNANMETRKFQSECCSPENMNMVTTKSYYKGAFLPHSLQRTTSLPVDAIDF